MQENKSGCFFLSERSVVAQTCSCVDLAGRPRSVKSPLNPEVERHLVTMTSLQLYDRWRCCWHIKHITTRVIIPGIHSIWLTQYINLSRLVKYVMYNWVINWIYNKISFSLFIIYHVTVLWQFSVVSQYQAFMAIVTFKVISFVTTFFSFIWMKNNSLLWLTFIQEFFYRSTLAIPFSWI